MPCLPLLAPLPRLAFPRLASFTVATLTSLALTAGCGNEVAFSNVGPEIALTPQTLFVGNIWIGDTQTRTVTLSNTGNVAAGEVEVSLQQSTGPAAAMVQLPNLQSLGVASELLIEIRVTGLGPGAGLFTAVVEVDVDGQAFTLPIQASITAAPSCASDNPCQISTFDFATGSCRIDLRADGSACEDNNVCTLQTQCSAGQCVGVMLDCDDGVACTADVCDPTLGCQPEPVNARCDDEDPCSDDICSPELGCQNNTSADGTLCFQDGCSSIGLCLSGNCLLSDVTEGFPCDDGDSCTFAETCALGECGGGVQGAVAASEPRSVLDGTVSVDLCMGSPGDCAAWAEGSFEEILAVHERQGSSYIIWRSDFFRTYGGACDPLSEQMANDTTSRNGGISPTPPDAPVPLDDTRRAEEDGDPEPPDGNEAPGAALVDACAAGIFLTVVQPDLGQAPIDPVPTTTWQLAATRGPAAASFLEIDTSLAIDPVPTLRVGVVVSLGIDLLLVEKDVSLDSVAASDVRSVQLGRTSDLGIPMRRLAMAYGPEASVTIAGTGAIRQASICAVMCDDPGGCCDSWVELFSLSATSSQTEYGQLVVPESYDASCSSLPVWAPGYSWETRDLQVSSGENPSITFLMEPFPCADATMGPDSVLAPMRFAKSSNGSWFADSPALFAEANDGTGQGGIVRLHALDQGQRLVAAVVRGCSGFDTQPGTHNDMLEISDCERTVLSSDAFPVALTQDWGSLEPYAYRIDVLPLNFAEQDFMLARSDGMMVLQRLEGGVATGSSVLGFVDGTHWRETATMRSTGDLLVGIADLTTTYEDNSCCPDGDGQLSTHCDAEGNCDGNAPEAPDAPGAEVCSCGSVSITVPRLATQRFGCNAP